MNNINNYFEKQEHFFLHFFRILNTNKNNFNLNYGKILSSIRKYDNLYKSYFDFIIDNFIFFLSYAYSKKNSNNFIISEDADIILKVLNSKIKDKYKEIYINYINKETLNKIESKQINNEEIRDFFEKQKNKY